jgi:hypothetical protein
VLGRRCLEWRCQLKLATDKSGVEANRPCCEPVRYAFGELGSALLALRRKAASMTHITKESAKLTSNI